MTTASIRDYRVRLSPSKTLLQFISDHLDVVKEIPRNINSCLKQCNLHVPEGMQILTDVQCAAIKSHPIDIDLVKRTYNHYDDNHCVEEETQFHDLKDEEAPRAYNFTTNEDIQFYDVKDEEAHKTCGITTYLYIADLRWLNNFLRTIRKEKDLNCYLHDFLPTCELILPENEVVERNPELEARCQKLRLQQENQEYHRMTKNVDAVLRNYPEDTIAYQVKAINKQIIAVLQFVLSVVGGFFFGFLGIELIVGNLDFGFRLLLGIMCALIIALAEIYFLAKKLNEIDDTMSTKTMHSPKDKQQKAHID